MAFRVTLADGRALDVYALGTDDAVETVCEEPGVYREMVAEVTTIYEV